jgi:hypothetical protein
MRGSWEERADEEGREGEKIVHAYGAHMCVVVDSEFMILHDML